MSLLDLLPPYRVYMAETRGLAVTSCRAYARVARAFLRWLDSNAMAEVTQESVRCYIAEFKTTHRPRSTRHTIHALICFGEFLVIQGHCPTNPVRELLLPKVDAPLRDVPHDSEVADLLEACDRLVNDTRVALARAVVSVLVHTGMRRAELLALRVSDVSQKDKTITIRCGKGGKFRTVYPPAECMDALHTYLLCRPADCQHDYLFAHNRTQRFGSHALKSLLEQLAAIAGHKGATNLKPHSLRQPSAQKWSLA